MPPCSTSSPQIRRGPWVSSPTSSVVGCPSCSRSSRRARRSPFRCIRLGSRRSSNGSSPGMRSMSMTGPSRVAPRAGPLRGLRRAAGVRGIGGAHRPARPGRPRRSGCDARNAGDPRPCLSSQPSCRPRPARWPISPAGSSRVACASRQPTTSSAEATAAIVGIAEDHPDDIGLAVLLLMHHRVLPWQFIDVAAGCCTPYVRGLGIEVLANSDNVGASRPTASRSTCRSCSRIVGHLGGRGGRSAAPPERRGRDLRFGLRPPRLFRVDVRRSDCPSGRVRGSRSPYAAESSWWDRPVRAVVGDAESLSSFRVDRCDHGGDGELYVVATPAD